MLATIARQRPGATPTYLMWTDAGTRGQQVAIYVAPDRRLTRAEQWLFAGDGRLVEHDGTIDGGLGWRLYSWVSPLHYATYGGLLLKLAYVVFGMALTAIVATGGTIWLARRRDQGRPTPVLERMWAALVWGQPVALALVALAVLANATWLPSLVLYWGATLALLVAARVWRDGDATARRLRHAGALLLVAVAVVHLATRGTPGPMPVAIDLALLALALWLVPAIRLPGLGAMPSRSLLHP